MLITMVSRSGMGFIQPPLRTAAVRALPATQLARGSGTLNFFRQLGGAFGISALVIAVEQRTRLYSEALSATQTSDNDTSQELLGQVIELLREAGIPDTVQDLPGALATRQPQDDVVAYVCKGQTCGTPLTDRDAFINTLSTT